MSAICVSISAFRPLRASTEPSPSTKVVSSLLTTICLHLPRSSRVTVSNLRPISSEITVPPVRIAISSSIAFRRSPKPGALTAATLSVPRSLFTTRVASASPSTSSAITKTFLLVWRTFSRTGRRSEIAEIFCEVIKT